ncbi:alanine racemase [Paenactinomyces guangxiensis]|uniref:Alanine racemase n=1 Tax=Paenactinomyces guangxiensis TaxID=1490290 RepID=A0A7W1WQQ2_9BACL|nr:alanine racemase [Paenactinomyces guangxiensis]MBA4494318.1 alanine racemase [Paenactinomyces guangxiensis]MBH8590813.1 alanine racemase [Paenactinomyces guangxiensis]
MRIDQLDTPSLLLDKDKMEANLNEIADFASEQRINWRPHIKTHKCLKIARRQIEKGAVGITVAKISEAEVMASGGVKDILIAYPISAPEKINRLSALMKDAQIKVAVDHVKQAKLLQDSLQGTPWELEVWIKVNSGLNRCGVEPGREVLQLAKQIANMPNLTLTGIFTHAGHSYAASSMAEIESIALTEGRAVAESAALCEKEGIPIPARSVGSTPTYKIAGKVSGITEVRPGNAVFFDAIQVGLGVASIDQCALRLLASVVSKRSGERVIFDTGSKALSLDQGAHGNATVKGFGHVVDHPEIRIERLSEEHGIASIDGETTLDLTDKVQIIPNHACTVMNLFDHVIVHRQGIVIDQWRIEARGKVQ